VLVAIFRNLLGVLFHCIGFDDRIVAFAVVVSHMATYVDGAISSIKNCVQVILVTSTLTCACDIGICATSKRRLVAAAELSLFPPQARGLG
jgi:hypothetical protein